MELIDIGVNLTHKSFSADLDDVLHRAHSAGVAQMVITGTSIDESRTAADLASRHEPLFATAGIHPHHASEYGPSTDPSLRELALSPPVVAIGETGLDYFRNFSPHANQCRAFEAQLTLAAELQLPVFLHERDATDDFTAILKEHRSRLCRAVAHCFTGDRDALTRYLDLDLHIGITGWICDERRGLGLRTLVRDIPADRLMIETDAPYLLPRDLKPKPAHHRNEPAFLPHIAETVARCRGESPTDLAARTTANARAFFALGH